jgi:HK97 family phage prohead protease
MPQPPFRPPETKRLSIELKSIDADGTFTGYASLFGREDLSHDVVEPGAFAASLARRGLAAIKMLWHHDPAEPIGRWLAIHEDQRGLAVRGQLLTDLDRAREALVLMRAGAVDGLSIGFRTVRARTDKAAGIRRLLEVDLWEISVVTFPMLPDARIAAVKGTRPRAPVAPPTLAARIRRATSLLNKDLHS